MTVEHMQIFPFAADNLWLVALALIDTQVQCTRAVRLNVKPNLVP